MKLWRRWLGGVGLFCLGIFFLGGVLGASLSGAALGEEEQFNFAQNLYRDGLYDLARQQFRLYLQDFPLSPRAPEAEFLAADSALRLNLTKEAAQGFEAFLARHPQHPRLQHAQLGLAQVKLQMQDWEGAQRALAEVEQKATDPKILAEAQAGRGDLFYQKGDYQRAALYYGKVLLVERPREQSAGLLYRQGDAFFKIERFEEAKKSFEEAIKAAGPSELARRARLRLALLVQQSEGAEAAKPLLEGILKDPPSAAHWEEVSYALAWGYFQEGQFKEAGEAFKNLAAKFPQGEKRKPALLYLADCLFHQQRYPEAQKAYQDFLTAYPHDPLEARAQWGIIWSMVREGKQQEAAYLSFKAHQAQLPLLTDEDFQAALTAWGEKNYPRVLELLPKTLMRFPREEAFWLMVLAYEGQADFKKAQETLTILQKEFPQGHYRLKARWKSAKILHRQGQWAVSRDNIQDLLAKGALGKDAAQGHFLIAQSWEKEHKYLQALETYLVVAENYPQSPRAQAALTGAADSAYWAGDYGRALSLYQKCWEQQKDPRHLYGIFLCRVKLKDLEGAEKNLAELEKIFPQGLEIPRAQEELGKAQAALGRWPEAQKWLERAEKPGTIPAPHIWSAKLARGWSLYNGQAKEAAKELFLQILADSPPDPVAKEAHYALGVCFHQAGNPQEAISHLEAYLKATIPDGAYYQEALWLLGQNRLKNQDTAGALAAFQELLAVDPLGPRADMAQLFLEEIPFKAGNFIKSLEANPQYLTFNPTVYQDLGAQARRAQRLLARGDRGHAQKLLEHLLTLKLPSSQGEIEPQAKLLLAQSYLPSKPERAEKLLREVGEHFPQSNFAPPAILLLGDILRERRDYPRALGEYRRLYVGYPKSPEAALALYQAAQCQRALKDEAGALASLVRLLEEHPQAVGLKNHWVQVGLFFQQAGQWDRADQALRYGLDVAQDPPAQAEAHFYLAQNLYLRGNLDQALLEFLKVSYLYPRGGDWVVASKYKAGEIYERKGQWAQAISLYEKVLVSIKDEHRAGEIRQRLQNLRQKLGRAGGS